MLYRVVIRPHNDEFMDLKSHGGSRSRVFPRPTVGSPRTKDENRYGNSRDFHKTITPSFRRLPVAVMSFV